MNSDHPSRTSLDRRTTLQLLGGAGALLLAPTWARATAGPDLAAIRKQVVAQHDANVKRLQDWIRVPGIAAENHNMGPACAFTEQLLRDAGFQHVERVETHGQPGIFATLDAGAKHTLGLYFMYDVKQVNPSEWSSPPFDAALVDKAGFGKVVVGRGAVNQKGPEATFLAALHAIRGAGQKLPVNLVLVAEGEEEIASPHFADVVHRPDVLAALRRCEGIFMPFASQDPDGAVEINLGAKGVIELELVASGEHSGRGPSKDVHSSLKAAVDSPAWRLVQALNTLVTADGNDPAIDGWFDDVVPLSAHEKELIAAQIARSREETMLKSLGVKHWVRDMSFSEAMDRLAGQPTANIEGLVSGYTGQGGKTILPGRAVAKMDFRLVPNQTAAGAQQKLRAHLAKRGFGDIEVNVTGGYDPTTTDEHSRLIKVSQAIYHRHGIEPGLNPRLGGSWPGYIFTGEPLKLPAGHFGLGHGSGAHAPNEYYVIESSNPKVAGLDDAVMSHVEYLYELAAGF
ncbi:MAG: M20/M25/M40 family metallo-hydrolase [Proteobacteria bacterium]|nr:M20/M25/M40 family metallo-hydrolase [Pseudomonadota bacterium]